MKCVLLNTMKYQILTVMLKKMKQTKLRQITCTGKFPLLKNLEKTFKMK